MIRFVCSYATFFFLFFMFSQQHTHTHTHTHTSMVVQSMHSSYIRQYICHPPTDALGPSRPPPEQACGALALPLAIAGSLPAVRCRSDEAAWANLHSILSHKATRLGESSRGRGHRRGRSTASNVSSASAPPAMTGGAFGGGGGGWANNNSGSSGNLPSARGTGADRGGSGGVNSSSAGSAFGGGMGGIGRASAPSISGGSVSSSGSRGGSRRAGGGSGPLSTVSGGSGGGGSGGLDSRDSEPPPWVGAVLWASLHALPKVLGGGGGSAGGLSRREGGGIGDTVAGQVHNSLFCSGPGKGVAKARYAGSSPALMTVSWLGCFPSPSIGQPPCTAIIRYRTPRIDFRSLGLPRIEYECNQRNHTFSGGYTP